MKLSEHFSLKEATFSLTAENLGLRNEPNGIQLERMKYTAKKMEEVREILGGFPIKVNSWFRGPEVNKAVGGVSTSQHSRGEAVDFTCAWFGSAKEIALMLQKHKDDLGYDQLIYEQTWVHISFSDTQARKNDFTLIGKGEYAKGIV